MRAWTVHMPPIPATGTAAADRAGERRRPPVLVPEGFSWGAFLFGSLWLLARGFWLLALAWLLAAAAAVLLLPAAAPAVFLAMHLLLGCHARDLQRRRLDRRGYELAHVVVEGDHERALARLLAVRPDLAAAWGRAALA